jgi:N-acetyltransferase 10
MTPFDIKRLESYANNMLDYHVILDLLPTAGSLYFEKRLGEEVRLSAVQSAILLAIGLQRKTVEEVEAELQLPVSQALALFAKVVKKISKRLYEIQKAAVSATIPDASAGTSNSSVVEKNGGPRSATTQWKPVDKSLEAELEEAGDAETRALREKQRAMIDALDISR